jgi:hypothetical protein
MAKRTKGKGKRKFAGAALAAHLRKHSGPKIGSISALERDTHKKVTAMYNAFIKPSKIAKKQAKIKSTRDIEEAFEERGSRSFED